MQPAQQRSGFFNRLPLELLCLISNDLELEEVSDFQVAIGRHLGDRYWQSRTNSSLFYEVRALSGQAIDWEALCLGLFDIELRKWGTVMGRDFVIKELDRLADALSGPQDKHHYN